jgi:hypothetical protein
VALCHHVQSSSEFLLTQARKLRFRQGFLLQDRSDEGNPFFSPCFHGGNDGGRVTARLLPKTLATMTARCGGPPTLGLAQTEVS